MRILLPLHHTYDTVLNMLAKLRNDIDMELGLFLKETTENLELKKASGLLFSGLVNFLGRSGKRIRPLLFILGYLGYTKKRKVPRKQLLRSSLSLELLHDFLLVHDDVIDNSDLRRGKPTLHRVFNSKLGVPLNNDLGANLSIVTGDIMFAMAVDALSEFDAPPKRKKEALKIFTNIAAATGIGEFLDVVNNVKEIEKITRRDVFLTYILKTARYTFEGPLLIGAILAGASKAEQKKLSGLALALGQAFQIQDDLLDVFSTSKKTGKPILSDLDESKKTLLVWKTYKDLKGKDKATFARLMKKDKKTYQDLLKIRKLIKTTGARDHCLKTSDSFFKEAHIALKTLKMAIKHKNTLTSFITDLSSKTVIERKAEGLTKKSLIT